MSCQILKDKSKIVNGKNASENYREFKTKESKIRRKTGFKSIVLWECQMVRMKEKYPILREIAISLEVRPNYRLSLRQAYKESTF